MNLPIAQKFRILQPRNQPQHPRLFAKLQVILKSDQVVAVRAQILLAQLHHRPRRLPRSRIAQPHRLHRPKAQRIAPPRRQHFDRQTALKIVELLPLFALRRLRRQQRIEKAVILRAIHRAVDVVRRALVPSRRKIHPLHVDRLRIHNRRNRIVKRQVPRAGDPLRSPRSAHQKSAAPSPQSSAAYCPPRHQDSSLLRESRESRLGRNRLRNPPRKLHAIHSQRMARRNRRLIGNAQKRRTRAPHLLLQQPRRRIRRFALQRIRADQFAKIRRLVRRRQPRLSIHHRAHLVEIHLAAQPRRRQRRLRPRQPSANHANLSLAPAPHLRPAASSPRRSRARSATHPETPRPWRDKNQSPAYSSPEPPTPAAGNPSPPQSPPLLAAAPCRSPARETPAAQTDPQGRSRPAHPRRIVEKAQRKARRLAIVLGNQAAIIGVRPKSVAQQVRLRCGHRVRLPLIVRQRANKLKNLRHILRYCRTNPKSRAGLRIPASFGPHVLILGCDAGHSAPQARNLPSITRLDSASPVFRPCAEASVGFTFGRAEESTRCAAFAATTAPHSIFPVIDVPGYSRRRFLILSGKSPRAHLTMSRFKFVNV